MAIRLAIDISVAQAARREHGNGFISSRRIRQYIATVAVARTRPSGPTHLSRGAYVELSEMPPLSDDELRAVAMKVGPPRGGNRRYLALDVEAVRQLLALGYSYSQIGQVFGCSRETIRRRLNGA